MHCMKKWSQTHSEPLRKDSSKEQKAAQVDTFVDIQKTGLMHMHVFYHTNVSFCNPDSSKTINYMFARLQVFTEIIGSQ